MSMNTKRTPTLRLSIRLLKSGTASEMRAMLVGTLLLIGASTTMLLQPWPVKLVLDSVLGERPPPGWLARLAELVLAQLPILGDPRVALLLVLCLGVLLVQLLVGMFNVLSTYVLVSIGLRMVFKLRCAVFDRIQQMSLSFHDVRSVGDSLYRVTWDTYCVQTLFNGGVVPAITAAITLAGIAAVMLTVDWAVTVAALVIGLPLVLLIRRLDRPMTERSLRVHERESDVSSLVQETLGAIRAVQAFGRETYEGVRFRRHAQASLRANLLLTVLQTGSQAIVGLLLAAGTAGVVWLGATRALAGGLTPGDVVLLVAYVAMLYKPLETLSYTAAIVQGAAAGGRRVFEILDAESGVADADDATELVGRAAGHVVFENVSFGYRIGHPVLSDFSLDIPPGATVALVGASGAGKTTLASLLPRFYDPTAGRITLDGRDLRSLTLESLRRNVALVLQEPILFSATIRENIAYSRSDATVSEIEAAARSASAHLFIEALPNGYETQIGERGVSLSGGQRQRLAIARAFLKDAPLLVMDEPTSALDGETEAYLLRSLAELSRGRTTIIIAHRLSTIRNADLVVVLEEGRKVQQGTHRELSEQPGVFRRLHQAAAV